VKTIINDIPTINGAEVRLMISDKNWLETLAVDQLKKTAELPGICCGVGLPDLHPGKGQPIGAAFVSKNAIYPHLVGSDIGCGMGLWSLDVPANKIRMDRWEKKLTGLDDQWDGDIENWVSGLQLDKKQLDKKQFGKKEFCKKGFVLNGEWAINNKLGTIGGGNHFSEIQRIHEVFSGVELDSIGLTKNSVVLLVHSGSRGLGQKILREHVDKHGASPLWANCNNSDEKGTENAAKKYLDRHDYAVQWAMLNRQLIAKRFSDCLGVDCNQVINTSHNSVMRLDEQSLEAMNLLNEGESGIKKGDSFWIHRKGANPTDQGLVMIPGSRGSLSYLVKPRVGNTSQLARGAFSLAHGAGRKWKRSDVRGRLENSFKVKDLLTTKFGGRVICKQRDLLYEEAAQAYKNIDVVISDMVEAEMIDVIASFKPVITYKTRKSK